MNEMMVKYLKSLELEGRQTTIPSYRSSLVKYDAWLSSAGLDPLKMTLAHLQEFQRWLTEAYRKRNGDPLSRNALCSVLSTVKTFHFWMMLRRYTLIDPAARLKLPKTQRKRIGRDHLTQQEAIALLQTAAKRIEQVQLGSRKWAKRHRALALLALGIASGRRVGSLRGVRCEDLDFQRNEVRIDWEKGKPGRVLPIARWAMVVIKKYIDDARPILLGGIPGRPNHPPRKDPGWLFVGFETDRVSANYLGKILSRVQADAAEQNPDLEQLAAKKLTAHSLRVSFAKILFLNGCNIRVINEMLLHERLSTTATYTPLEVEDLRRACRSAHPRA